LTIVARTGRIGRDRPQPFDPLFWWAAGAGMTDDLWTVSIRPMPTGATQQETIEVNEIGSVRLNAVNPALIDPLTGVAPFVFDMRVRPLLLP
jgi:hypothetical protein